VSAASASPTPWWSPWFWLSWMGNGGRG
jgi:hypothetical protein